LIPQTGRRVRHPGSLNLYKSCVPCPCAYLRVLGLPIMILHRVIYYLGYPLGRAPGRGDHHHRRIRRTFVNKINLLNMWLVYSATKLPTRAELNYLHGRRNRRVTSTSWVHIKNGGLRIHDVQFFPRSLPDETESRTKSNCKQEAQLLAAVSRAHTSPLRNIVSSCLASRTNSGSNTSKQQIDFSKSTEVLRTCMRLLHMQS
jgi:hypothetical protein